MDRDFYGEIYRLLDEVTPLKEDCGRLCDKACCRPVYPDTGIYLFPGEETMFDRAEGWLAWSEQKAEEHDFPPSWRGTVYFVRCEGVCPRRKRPLQCRLFPLAAHYLPEGHLVLIWETLALPYRCPLLSGNFPLEQAFVQAAATAWRLLVRHPLIDDLVRWDSRRRCPGGRKVVPFGKPCGTGGVRPWRIVKVVTFNTPRPRPPADGTPRPHSEDRRSGSRRSHRER